jgi:hypothetical protein
LPASCRPRRDWRGYPGGASAAELAGHNPLGALSVLACWRRWACRWARAFFGRRNRLPGPLAARVSSAAVKLATRYHTTLGKLLVIALVILHVAAIVWYQRHGRKLVRPMVSGDKALAEPVPAARDDASRGPPRSSCWPWPAAWSMRWCNGATRRDWDRLRRIIRPARACLLHFSHAVDTRPPIDLIVAQSPEELAGARALFQEYAEQLGVDLDFQHFEAELAELPATTPRRAARCCWPGRRRAGRLLRAAPDRRRGLRQRRRDEAPVRAQGVSRLRPGPPAGRSHAGGGPQIGYGCVLLDTLDDMESARALYEDLGFEEIPPYYHNPLPGRTT